MYWILLLVYQRKKKGDEDENNDDDGNDDGEYVYKIDTYHNNTKKDVIIGTFDLEWSADKDSFMILLEAVLLQNIAKTRLQKGRPESIHPFIFV